MCDVLDRVEEKGRQEEKRRTAASLHSMGMTEEFIAKAVGVSVDLVKKWLDPAIV